MLLQVILESGNRCLKFFFEAMNTVTIMSAANNDHGSEEFYDGADFFC